MLPMASLPLPSRLLWPRFRWSSRAKSPATIAARSSYRACRWAQMMQFHVVVPFSLASSTIDLKHDIKDTLHGIENKSYGAQHRSRHSPDRRLSSKLRILVRLFAWTLAFLTLKLSFSCLLYFMSEKIFCRHSGGGRYRHHSPDARDRYR